MKQLYARTRSNATPCITMHVVLMIYVYITTHVVLMKHVSITMHVLLLRHVSVSISSRHSWIIMTSS